MSSASDTGLGRLTKQLGYEFTDKSLLRLALTHRSASANHNERLEFLGDSVLGFVVAELLYTQRRKSTEGDLSRLRASMVSKPALAAPARAIGLGEYLNLGSGESKSGGRERVSILADAVEAVIAAVYLDGGLSAATAFIRRLVAIDENSGHKPSAEKDSKTALQELLQARKTALPVYDIVSIEGAAHEQVFRVECRIEGVAETFDGVGESKKEAEQAAAERALLVLGESK